MFLQKVFALTRIKKLTKINCENKLKINSEGKICIISSIERHRYYTLHIYLALELVY